MPKLALVDDHALFREGLCALLQRIPDVKVTHLGSTLADANELIEREDLDALVLDLRLPDGHATELIERKLLHDHQGPKVVVISAHIDRPTELQLLSRGVSACLCKSAPFEAFRDSLERIGIAKRRSSIEPLTRREFETLDGLDRGLSNKEIARTMGTTPGTVKNYINTLYQKLQVQKRMQAVLRAQELGILHQTPEGVRAVVNGLPIDIDSHRTSGSSGIGHTLARS